MAERTASYVMSSQDFLSEQGARERPLLTPCLLPLQISRVCARSQRNREEECSCVAYTPSYWGNEKERYFRQREPTISFSSDHVTAGHIEYSLKFVFLEWFTGVRAHVRKKQNVEECL